MQHDLFLKSDHLLGADGGVAGALRVWCGGRVYFFFFMVAPCCFELLMDMNLHACFFSTVFYTIVPIYKSILLQNLPDFIVGL